MWGYRMAKIFYSYAKKYFLWKITSNSLTENEEHDISSQIMKTIFGLHASVIFRPQYVWFQVHIYDCAKLTRVKCPLTLDWILIFNDIVLGLHSETAMTSLGSYTKSCNYFLSFHTLGSVSTNRFTLTQHPCNYYEQTIPPAGQCDW